MLDAVISPLFRIRIILSVIAVCVLALISGSTQTDPFFAEQEARVLVSQWQVKPYPVATHDPSNPSISAISAHITDENTGAVLYSKNATIQYPPASVTKLMTALVARDEFKPGLIVTVPPMASFDSRRLFLPGDQVQIETLIAAALIQSSNDAAHLIADQVPGGQLQFVDLMNQKAMQLKLPSTAFANPTGFDHPAQRITARDLNILAREVIKDPIYRRLVATARMEVYDVTGQRAYRLTNTHQLIHQDARVSGIKTGTTTEAGQVLVTLARVNGQQVIISVLGSENRYLDTLLLMQWLERSYDWVEPKMSIDTANRDYAFSKEQSMLY